MLPIKKTISELKSKFGAHVTPSESDCNHHGRDPGHEVSIPPDAVAYPKTTEEV